MESRRSGFTRFECLIVIAVLAMVSAVVVPASARELAFARRAIAQARVEQIGRTVRQFLRDVQLKPKLGGYGGLVGAGVPPRPVAASDGLQFPSLDSASPPPSLAPAFRGTWKGPYELNAEADAYGRAYVVTPLGDPSMIVWCLSAGPNGVLETTTADLHPRGDDVGVRVD